jgi:HTH-type transcriptional regulator, sugar sensing transcriptional regulator
MFVINDEDTRTLIDLGLTGAQVRIYLALLRTGTSSIREVAKNSGVARPDTYRAIAGLQELGLVEKLLTTPTKFKPLPSEDAIGILMLRRTRESIELNERANRLIKNLEEKKNNAPPLEESQFILVPKGETLELKAQKMIENAQETISIVAPRKRTRPFVANNLDMIKNALKRKVDIRTITEKYTENKSTEFLELQKFRLFEIEYAITEPRVLFILVDNKEILLMTSAKLEYSESPAVWSNNPGLIELAQGYFELTWTTLSEAKMIPVL